MGQTPGFLSSAIKWQATNAETPLGATYVVQSFLAKAAKEQNRSSEDKHFQQEASVPEGSAAPSILAICLIKLHLIDQKEQIVDHDQVEELQGVKYDLKTVFF